MSTTTFFFLFVPILAIVLLAVNLIFAPHNPYQEKDSAFECGFHSFLGQNRTQFSISFFIFALLFLLFDLEILLVYPYVVSAYTNGIYGLVIMLIFFGALTFGLGFEFGKNALNIESRQTIISNDNSLTNNTYINKSQEIIIESNFFNFKNFYIEYIKPFLKILPFYIFILLLISISTYYFSFPFHLNKDEMGMYWILFILNRFILFFGRTSYNKVCTRITETSFYARFEVYKEKIDNFFFRALKKELIYSFYWNFQIEKLSQKYKDVYSLKLINDFYKIVKETEEIYRILSSDWNNSNTELKRKFFENLLKLTDIEEKFKRHIEFLKSKK